MLRLLCARRVLEICLLTVRSSGFAGCSDQSTAVPQTQDMGAPSQAAPSLTGDGGATTGSPTRDASAPGQASAGPALASDAGPARATSDAGPTTDSSMRDAGGPSPTGPTHVVPSSPDASSPSQPDASLAKDAGPATEPATGDAGAVTNSPAITSGDSVFFVGNSFFSSFDRVLPDWVSAIGRAVTPPITIKTGLYCVPGNQKLSWFLQQQESQDALNSRAYKVFVIQAEEREAVDNTEGFKQAVRDWNQAIIASGATTMLFMTWDLPDEKGSTFFARLTTAYDEIGAELGIPVIPVGRIYDDCNKAPFPGQTAGSYWLTGGALHQVESGSAVNAYATFGMLTGVNPMGCPIDAPANTNSPDMLKYLSDMSWARVAPLVSDSK